MRTIRAEQVKNLFAGNIRKLLLEAPRDYERIYEIRLRVGRPIFLCYDGGEKFLRTKDAPYLVTRQDLKETLEYISGYSLYACEDELRQGYISVQGGHRVGVTGKVILNQGNIRSIKYISCVNVRLAHQILGCADAVMPFIRKKEKICHTLLISPPGFGKTTLLRDMVRQLSKEEDFRAVESVIHCGCTLLATAHGNSLEDIMEQPFFQKLKSMQVFERYIILGRQNRNGRIVQILDGKGKPC